MMLVNLTSVVSELGIYFPGHKFTTLQMMSLAINRLCRAAISTERNRIIGDKQFDCRQMGESGAVKSANVTQWSSHKEHAGYIKTAQIKPWTKCLSGWFYATDVALENFDGWTLDTRTGNYWPSVSDATL